jgi:UDP-N-acetylmuramoylalanine--D-glutamate ligase
MLDLDGQRVLVLGAGLSGRSAAAFCAGLGARVTLADEQEIESAPVGVEIHGSASFPDPGDYDLVVPSPGVPPQRYRERARRVWGDIELASRALAVPIAAVTGTNGKSTTVRLLEAMLRSAGLRARAAGNVGEAALDLVGEPLDVAVLEVSSFQLETVDAFRPRVAVLLNLTPDHLDRHGSTERYLAAKARIFENQGAEDVAIVNADPALDDLATGLAARVLRFGARGSVEQGACWDGDAVCLCARTSSPRSSRRRRSAPSPTRPCRRSPASRRSRIDRSGWRPSVACAS